MKNYWLLLYPSMRDSFQFILNDYKYLKHFVQVNNAGIPGAQVDGEALAAAKIVV